ncbi:MAG: group II intron reverse transcriptase domain-containing protein [Clostridia bacterium]|nr:group II intron reverse transcriptase domain-containing protein [Clostridia bacterium]
MTLLDRLFCRQEWESFYVYRTSLVCPKGFTKELRTFIDGERYLDARNIVCGTEKPPLPKRSVISKMSSAKKRVVYTYPEPLNTVLKLLTFLLIREYDGIFSDNLYSFRPGVTAKDAVRRLMRTRGIFGMYSYKADISDYFNSVPVESLLAILKDVLANDAELYRFLESLLTEHCVLDAGKVTEERKGIMAGTPLSSFYANLYLSALDRDMGEKGVLYARYSDDIILFSGSDERCRQLAGEVKMMLSSKGLSVNSSKERFFLPEDGFEFLGFSVRGGRTDIAPSTVKKLKGKMRRKRDALLRWKERGGEDAERAAGAFIRVFNRKLFEQSGDSELTWSRWFFPVINTTESLHEIDVYAQDCIRTILTGSRGKSRYRADYAELKKLGYRTLVSGYYASLAPENIKED